MREFFISLSQTALRGYYVTRNASWTRANRFSRPWIVVYCLLWCWSMGQSDSYYCFYYHFLYLIDCFKTKTVNLDKNFNLNTVHLFSVTNQSLKVSFRAINQTPRRFTPGPLHKSIQSINQLSRPWALVTRDALRRTRRAVVTCARTHVWSRSDQRRGAWMLFIPAIRYHHARPPHFRRMPACPGYTFRRA